MTEQGKFLTDSQREYLKGEGGPDTKRAEDQTRYRIRKNTKQAIEELALVAKQMGEEDVTQLFQEPQVKANEAAQNDSIAEMVLSEHGEKAKDYKEMVRVLSMFYEIHWRNGWDFSDTLRLAIEQAHGDPRLENENPRNLPRREVNEEEFEFTPALESVETHEEKIERIREKANNREEALTDEEQLFYIKNILWDDDKELREFLHEQNQRRREQEALDAILDRPWLDDE